MSWETEEARCALDGLSEMERAEYDDPSDMLDANGNRWPA